VVQCGSFVLEQVVGGGSFSISTLCEATTSSIVGSLISCLKTYVFVYNIINNVFGHDTI